MSRSVKKPREQRRPKAKFSRAGLIHYRVLAADGIDWQNGNIPQGEILTVKASSRYILVGRWIHVGAIVLEHRPLEGMCQVCKCTWSRACKDGCSWTSPARLLCTRCERRIA
jgi:hypothetical protein